MKNYKTIFFTLITSALILVGFVTSYYGEYVQFGTGRWIDTLANRITPNKAINLRPGDSLYYNGNVVTSGSGTSIDTNKYLSIYRLDTSKIGFLNQGNQWTELNEFTDITVSNSFQTIGSTTLADAIITGTLDVSSDAIFNNYIDYTGNGDYEKMIIVKGKTGANTNFNYTFAHGFTGDDYKRITRWDAMMRNDSSGGNSHGRLVKPLSWYSALSFYAKIDSLNASVTLPAASNLINDSVFFYIWYHP